MRQKKNVGIVICNYNKCEYLRNCIDSILNSNFTDYDLYVVDNHSEDDSVAMLKELFGSKLTIIENEVNLGGSGGFNTGLKRALEKDYPYLMCVDNDIVMEPNNLEKLYRFLESHDNVGIVGSKICRMDVKDRLQELGADIDFLSCNIKPLYKNCLDNQFLPIIQYCDYVPACSLMIRREVIDKIGLMPEENFIYWDDMEWGYRAKLAGYQVAALREAKVYHAMGTNTGESYFSTYYFWRNRITFFLKFATSKIKEQVFSKLAEELFQTLYGCYYKGKSNQIKVVMAAFDDALHHNMGKADSGRILLKDKIEDRIKKIFMHTKDIVIEFNGDYKFLQTLLNKAEDNHITILYHDREEVLRQHPEYAVVKSLDEIQRTAEYLVMCAHVTKLENFDKDKIYIDGYSNIVENEADIQHFKNYHHNKTIFIEIFKSLFTLLDGNEYECHRLYG